MGPALRPHTRAHGALASDVRVQLQLFFVFHSHRIGLTSLVITFSGEIAVQHVLYFLPFFFVLFRRLEAMC